MRIAYLTADFGVPVLGTKGASAHVRGLVEALRSEGHDLFVLAANIGDDGDPSFRLRHVPFGGTLIEPVIADAWILACSPDGKSVSS